MNSPAAIARRSWTSPCRVERFLGLGRVDERRVDLAVADRLEHGERRAGNDQDGDAGIGAERVLQAARQARVDQGAIDAEAQRPAALAKASAPTQAPTTAGVASAGGKERRRLSIRSLLRRRPVDGRSAAADWPGATLADPKNRRQAPAAETPISRVATSRRRPRCRPASTSPSARPDCAIGTRSRPNSVISSELLMIASPTNRLLSSGRRRPRAGPRPPRQARRLGRRNGGADRGDATSTGATAATPSTTGSCGAAGRRRHVHQAQPEAAPAQLSRAQQPERRRARRGPHLHLLASARKTPARPTTGWRPAEMRAHAATGLFDGCMRGRTMYVVPFSMGPLGSPIAHIGVELTDSAVRRGQHADHDAHGPRGARRARQRRRLRAVRAFGRRAARRRARRTCRGRATTTQVHRPLPGDARDLELRLGLRRQRAARQEVLRAAHRLDHGPRRRLARRAHADSRRDVARGQQAPRRGGVPERLRQDQLRDADPAAGRCTGWKVTTIGDDIAWIKPGKDGRLYAINPEAGYFGVAPGTSEKTNSERDGDARRRTRSSPTSRSPTTATSGGKA